MPISPDHGARLAYASVELVAAAELEILRVVARYLRAGIDAPDWAIRKRAELRMLRQVLARDLEGIDASLARQVEQTMERAYTEGQAWAVGDLDAAAAPVALPPAQMAAVQALAADIVARTVGLTPRVLRQVADAYQAVVAEASTSVLLGTQTRRQAAQTALDRLLGQGIGGFTDSAGRQWRLESYVEMAVRTGAGRSAVTGHVDTLIASGQDLVDIVPGPRACPICDQWAGRVLSVAPSGLATIGPRGRVTPRETLEDARAAGWGHPNCRCAIRIHIPGFTTPVTQRPDPRGYELQQQQRALERRIRSAKREEVLSLDAARERKARGKVRDAQAALRAHLKAHPELKRQTGRESITRAV